MKFVIVIPDGAADEAQFDLDDRTPLQAARMPNAEGRHDSNSACQSLTRSSSTSVGRNIKRDSDSF
jgi:2,3-bisphosphoglycerate-independent phosphoglycerate mutase